MNSNLSLVSSFIILMIGHWKGPEAVKKCGTIRTHYYLGVKEQESVDLELFPCVLKNQPAVTVLDNELQSQPCLTIHYTHD
eukprot:scaffold29620_cov45-Cyclotella_meneghiniana.AAC.1